MKHCIILITILLLSSHLFGQSKKDGLLYIWENGSRYIGEWKDGKKHGQGKYTSADNNGEGDKYIGEFKDGKVWNGKIYNGNFIYKIVNGE